MVKTFAEHKFLIVTKYNIYGFSSKLIVLQHEHEFENLSFITKTMLRTNGLILTRNRLLH